MVADALRALARTLDARAACAAVLSGVLIASVWLPPWPPWAIAFAFVPLLATWLRGSSWIQVLVAGVLCQWIVSAIAFAWIAPTVRHFFALPLPLALACWIVTAAVTNLHIPLIGLAWWSVVRRHALGPWMASALLAVAWVGLAQLYPTFVPFDYGYPWLWSELPLLHLADWVGFRGLALVTFFANALLAFACCAQTRRQRLHLVACTVALLLAANVIGAWHGRQWDPGERSVRMALVQPSFSWDETRRANRSVRADVQRVQELLRMSSELHARSPADLWVWPEGAVQTVLGGRVRGYEGWLSSLLAMPAVPVLAGVHERLGPLRLHNAAALFDRRGERVGTYHKEELFPFGEYVPVIGSWLVRGRAHLAAAEPGRPGILSTEGVRLGLTICFEALFPGLFRARAEEGAQIFVNLSNDQPFGDTAERHQHFYMARARAIELRRPLVRVALTGASAVVDRTGRVLAYAGVDRAWAETVEVPFAARPHPTVFQRYGYMVEHACLAVTLLYVVLLELRRRRWRAPFAELGALYACAAGPIRAALQIRRPRPARALLRRGAHALLALAGVASALGYLTGSLPLQRLGLLSAASPLPLVFGSLQGHEYWASRHTFELRLRDGSLREVRVDRALQASLPGPHRMHMVLAVPLLAGPVSPPERWSRLLEHGLCRSGPLVRAAAIDPAVDAAELVSVRSDGRTWRAPLVCPP